MGQTYGKYRETTGIMNDELPENLASIYGEDEEYKNQCLIKPKAVCRKENTILGTFEQSSQSHLIASRGSTLDRYNKNLIQYDAKSSSLNRENKELTPYSVHHSTLNRYNQSLISYNEAKVSSLSRNNKILLEYI